MAEWGKGDDRWIVQSRDDGRNVNNWHWAEHDCVGWVKSRVEQLVAGLVLAEQPRVAARVEAVESVDGEATINVRKNKLIPSYSLDIALKYVADVEAADGAKQAVTGKVVVPYLADENFGDDPEIQVRPQQDSKASTEAKAAIWDARKQTLLPKLVTLMQEIHAGVPIGRGPDGDGKEAPAPSAAAAPKPAPAPASAPAASKPKPTPSKHKTRITLKETFHASAMDVYEALTHEGRIRAYTQSEAKVSTEVGGSFSMFGGSILGIQRELVPGKRIVQDWRFNTWPDDVFSKVVLEIDEKEPGNTVVSLTQDGIPEEDKFGNHDVLGTTENGWRNLIFYRIRAVFGYGL